MLSQESVERLTAYIDKSQELIKLQDDLLEAKNSLIKQLEIQIGLLRDIIKLHEGKKESI